MVQDHSSGLLRVMDFVWPFPLGVAAAAVVSVLILASWLVVRKPSVSRASAPVTPAIQIVPTPEAAPGRGVVPPQPLRAVSASASDLGTAAAQTEASDSAPALSGERVADRPVAAPARIEQPRARISRAQQNELDDRLTVGRFLADRKDYAAATAEFQAALAIDPANREAQAALAAAQAARQHQNTPSAH